MNTFTNISKKLSYAGVGSILKVIAAFGIQKILAVIMRSIQAQA